ncbi:MAG: hypothetical protein PF487_00910, partial [Bacteroidales bacterium]|nr:hypothetical protein [Bacteroidales bacterium]
MLDFKQHCLFRKMDVDELLSATYKLYKNNFKILFLYSFIGLLIVQALSYYIGVNETIQNFDAENIQTVFKGIGGKITVLVIVTFAVYALLNVFLLNILYKTDIDNSLSHKDLFEESVNKYFLHMLFFLIISTLMFVVGMLAGIVVFIIGMFAAGLYLGTVLVPGGTIIVVEEKNAFDSIKRGFQLAHKDFWQALGSLTLYIIIMILISLVISAIIAIPFVFMFFGNFSETHSFWEAFDVNNFDLGAGIIVLNTAVAAVTYPITIVFSLVLYFKLRYKEEQSNIDV